VGAKGVIAVDPARSSNGHAGELSDRYWSAVIEIDAALAEKHESGPAAAPIGELSPIESERLLQARRCLELLYRQAAGTSQASAPRKSTRPPGITSVADATATLPEFNAVPGPEQGAGPEGNSVAPREKHLGRFRIIREVGRGGHGVVFLAHDPTLRRLVALKVPRPEALLAESMRRRFLAEGRTAAALTHPNIVTVFEAGELGPVCYLAQAYVSGITLAEWLRAQPNPVPARMAAEIVAQLADGVAHAHARGILHRDIKPSNVLLDFDGFDERAAQGPRANDEEDSSRTNSPTAQFSQLSRTGSQLGFTPKLADFGIAKTIEGGGVETLTGTVVGTLSYMAPEQAAGKNKELGPECDVYSLGSVLYELLTRKVVFAGNSLADGLRLVLFAEPVPPRKLRADVPRDLEAICLKCLEKERERRYRSAVDLAADLRRFAAGEPTRARPLRPPEQLRRWAQRKPALAATIGICLAAMTALYVHVVWSSRQLERQLGETNQQRQRAETNEKLANERELVAQTRAYGGDMRLLGESWQLASTASVESLLDTYVPKAGSPDVRGFEWWMLHRALHSGDSQVLGNHPGGVQSVAVNPQSDLAASGGSDGVVRIWNLRSGECLHELRGHKRGNIDGLAFSPDGTWLASGGVDATVRLWNAKTGQPVHCCLGHTGWVSSVVFSPDGARLVSGAADKAIIVWDVKSGKEIRRLLGHSDTVRALVFRALKPVLLFSASEDHTLRAWDFEQGTPSKLVPGARLKNPSNRWIRWLAVEPDQTTLMGIPFNDSPVLWDIRADHFEEIDRLSRAGNARSASIQGDARHPVVAYGLEESFVHVSAFTLHDPPSFQELRGHSGVVNSVALKPDATLLVSGSKDGSVRLWKLSRPPFVRMKKPAVSTIISPSGNRIAVAMADGEIELLDFETFQTIRRIRPAKSATSLMAFSRDSTILASVTNGGPLALIRLDDPAQKIRRIAIPRTSPISVLRLAPRGRFAAVIERATLDLVDVDRNSFRAGPIHDGGIEDAVFIDDAQLLVSTDRGNLLRWSFSNESPIQTIPLGTGALHEIAVSEDGRLAAVRGFRQVKVLALPSGTTVTTLPDHGESGSIAFLGNGRTLAMMSGNSSRLSFWQTSTWQRLTSINLPISRISVASVDGYRLVMLRDNEVHSIDARPVK
jgi:WD40 repeat protein/serine/threonine protein kinase